MGNLSIDEPVSLVEYREEWPRQARELVGKASRLVQRPNAQVEHIGSTAVPGLSAKPVIDLLVGVTAEDVSEVVARIRSAGWESLGEAGIPGRHYLRLRGSGLDANAHVVERGSQLWIDNIILRDYLRANPDAARRYADAKRYAARRANRLLDYSDYKREIVLELLADARAHIQSPGSV